MDVVSYIGLNKENKHRVEEYFKYITHYTHPAAEGVAFLNELPKPLYEEVTGEERLSESNRDRTSQLVQVRRANAPALSRRRS